jgi:P27 family predicted phage terminase small subunit
MVAGRKRIPTAVKIAQGTHRADRHGIPAAEPGDALMAVPEPPSGMGESAIAVWKSVLPLIVEAGYLSDLDLHSFERFCLLHEELKECERVIEDDGAYHVLESGSIQQHPAINRKMKILDLIRRYETDFWLTPTARAGRQVKTGKTNSVSSRKRTG